MRPAAMSDHHQIQSLMNDYCTAIDHGDFERFGELMRHAEWLVEGEKPAPASSTNVILYEDGTPRTKHVIRIFRSTSQLTSVQLQAIPTLGFISKPMPAHWV